MSGMLRCVVPAGVLRHSQFITKGINFLELNFFLFS